MAEQFKEQGGAATMDPSAAFRWISSRVMSKVISPKRLMAKRQKMEKHRQASSVPHVVEYFHQVEDGYSHLAAQALIALTERYDIELRCHLVAGPSGDNSVEPELLIKLSQYDASFIAPHYGLEAPGANVLPDRKAIELAESILTASILQAQASAYFAALATAVGTALWSGDQATLNILAEQHGCVPAQQRQDCLALGNARRAELKHYSGAMFYYAGEWYWGVDRLHYLEVRLADLGADASPDAPLLMPRIEVEAGNRKDNGSLTLEIYPSLRSPYTAVVFDQTLKLAETTGVNLVVRPVLPMVMRGVPATREKGMYIFTDAAREARSAGVPFGCFRDPIGEPARNCYSLYRWARQQGRGNQLISSFLSAAFAEGINTNNARGLKQVVENAGLDWSVAKTLVGETGWQELLESNRLAMYKAGLWGVPSFRLLNKRGESVLALWGQDRLWLVAREIERQLALDIDS
jgi:2-hydroxychromene-2-carboxylate isomerase